MNIAVIGTGYVGLSLACLIARRHRVRAVDVVAQKVDAVNAGVSPIKDPDIEALLPTGALDLAATLDAAWACEDADFVVIATPTNYDDERGTFDTGSIESTLCLLEELGCTAAVVVKSTVPVGYTDQAQAAHPSLRVLFSPEFLREGRALHDNLFPSRIIAGVPRGAGATSREAAERFVRLLADCADPSAGEVPTLVMDSAEAEAVKLFANTYLALRVAYFNELDTYAELRGLDTADIIRGVCLEPRIGQGYNNPSFGYGGYCLPKDTKQLLANYSDVPQNLIRAIVESNATRKRHVADRVEALGARRVGIYRLVMKEGSDNFRASSIFDVIDHLVADGADVVVYEPLSRERSYAGCPVVDDLEEFKRSCDVIVANRVDAALQDVMDKVYTRDLWHTS